jgi:propionyl-CoA synthetase
MVPHHLQDEVQRDSLANPEAFWSRNAEHLYWHKKPSQALKSTIKTLPGGISHPQWSWFSDGEINTSYNCIDRHVEAGNGDNVAIVWDSPVSGNKEKYTYKQLLREVETLAGVLREEGVRKGDVVLIYSMQAHQHVRILN